jgi:23S rRNA pseudouridine1911/1915/1917 synthase
MNIEPLIIAENEEWIVLNKPSGLLSIPDREGKTPSLKNYLQAKYGKIFIVHRLDKDTSGLILFAKNEASHKALTIQFEQRQIEKTYYALVHGVPNPAKGTLKHLMKEHNSKKGTYLIAPLGKEAITHYKVAQQFKKHSLLEVNIETGRTHQIRVHCLHLGCPIIADELYGNSQPLFLSSLKKKFNLSKNELDERPLLSRLALHAQSLSFMDTLTNTKQYFEAPLFKDMEASLKQLSKNN